MSFAFASAAALFAAHRAFIAAASCARRSGVRLSFLFAFLAAVGRCLTSVRRSWIGVKRRFLALFRVSLARAVDFLAVPPFVAAASFCFSLASFFAPFCRRASTRRIFLRIFLGFIEISCASVSREWRIRFQVNDEPHQGHVIICNSKSVCSSTKRSQNPLADLRSV